MLPLKLNIYEKNVLHLRVDSILRTVICKDIFNPQIMKNLEKNKLDSYGRIECRHEVLLPNKDVKPPYNA